MGWKGQRVAWDTMRDEGGEFDHGERQCGQLQREMDGVEQAGIPGKLQRRQLNAGLN